MGWEAWSQGGNNLTATMEHWGADLLSDALSFIFPIALKDSGAFTMMSSPRKRWISHKINLQRPLALIHKIFCSQKFTAVPSRPF